MPFMLKNFLIQFKNIPEHILVNIKKRIAKRNFKKCKLKMPKLEKEEVLSNLVPTCFPESSGVQMNQISLCSVAKLVLSP